MYCTLTSLGFVGIDAFIVNVEVDIAQGMPSFDIVGLPDTSVKESKDRVKASLKNLGYSTPVGKITVNLAPADVKKIGSMYDLPILIGILKSSGQISSNDLDLSAFIGEISLSGQVKAVNGVLPMVLKAKECGIENIWLPKTNAKEGSVVTGINIFPIDHISDFVNHINGKNRLSPHSTYQFTNQFNYQGLDFKDVKGQYQAKRALEIAAAGGHNVLLIGPPGSGKSMLAKRLPSILPPLTFDEAIETTKIHSISGNIDRDSPLVLARPFRSPHHTTSSAGLSGGGSNPCPGEISLAHNGVLFLDELPEFSRSTLEILRQPIEDSTITISRAKAKVSYPCSITLVCAMNPCPCGFYGHPTRVCTCPKGSVGRYMSKVSGPLLDRLDIHVEVMPVEFADLSSTQESECSSSIRERVVRARDRQINRYKMHSNSITCNAKLTPDKMQEYCSMTNEARLMIKSVFERMGLSARTYDKILKVARTIADLDETDIIDSKHIAEAIQYRNLDKKYWKNI